MTIPHQQNSYAVATGTSPIPSYVFQTRDPSPYDTTPNYVLQTAWVNTITNAIWYLEAFSSANGLVTSQWRAVGPIVVMTVDPTSSNYTYPIGQTWVNTTTPSYWALLNVVGTVATWLNLTGGGGGGGTVKTLTGNDSVAVSPDSSGNINVLGSGSLYVTGTTNTETISLTGLTAHNVLLGEGTSTIGLAVPSSTAGIPLVSTGSSSDPAFGTAVVPGGGTGDVSFTELMPICGGTTSTGSLQSVSSVGTLGDVLTYNSATSLPSWQPAGGSEVGILTVNMQVFGTAGSYTYTPSANMVYCIVEVVGPGGGGGGANNSNYAASGGGGGYARAVFSSAQIGASQSGTVGSGGAGGVGGSNGSAGSNTTFGSFITATSGAGGISSSTTIVTPGGNGGTATVTGVVPYFITTGNPGYGLSRQSNGPGGSSFFGGGANSVAYTGVSNGNPGTSYGGGGSGAFVNSVGNQNGGAGYQGAVIVTEYIFTTVSSPQTVVNYTLVTTAMSPYTTLSSDYYIGVDATAGAVTILLPNAPATGRIYNIKDIVGIAATNNIIITTVGGTVLIDGGTTFAMNVNYQSVQLLFSGTAYQVF